MLIRSLIEIKSKKYEIEIKILRRTLERLRDHSVCVFVMNQVKYSKRSWD